MKFSKVGFKEYCISSPKINGHEWSVCFRTAYYTGPGGERMSIDIKRRGRVNFFKLLSQAYAEASLDNQIEIDHREVFGKSRDAVRLEEEARGREWCHDINYLSDAAFTAKWSSRTTRHDLMAVLNGASHFEAMIDT